jgi:hypothetical protein
MTLSEAMVPDHLEYLGRALPDAQAKQVHDYVDGLSPEQRRGLAGARDRLAILAESDVANFLWRERPTRHNIDLLAAVRRRDVVLFRLDADRRPLVAGMLAAAIVQDLLTIASELQHQPVRRWCSSTSSPPSPPRRGAVVRSRPLRWPQPAFGHPGARRPAPAR